MAGCTDGSCARERDAAKAHDIYTGLRNEFHNIRIQYFTHQTSIADVEGRLHDAWDELIHTARFIPSNSAEQDRLVTLVLELREFRSMARSSSDDGEDAEAAVTSTSQWTHLPSLLQDAWTVESMGFDTAERRNLAALTARLCTVGVCEAMTASCALWLLSATLERDDDGAGPGLAQLLPACLAWLRHGGFKLLRLCAANYSLDAATADLDRPLTTPPGPLAVRANVVARDLSMERWLFWRRRLGQLYLDGAQPVAQLARECFDIMVGAGLPQGLNVPGERRYLERAFKALEEELVARGSTGCVDIEEIAIDPAWAED
ncbi:hypothetical protein G6O67_008757 [Ophiocordyceps sinensis]|uniref:Uncharacterized protein n=1 Tax=Ophiocordyceps sinensis TaxID=72228 RepID=A0A8H4PJF3_9HYPO|nr:hypothetical protein G6O67_008757 [Ophiocordyceps sinensis]